MAGPMRNQVWKILMYTGELLADPDLDDDSKLKFFLVLIRYHESELLFKAAMARAGASAAQPF